MPKFDDYEWREYLRIENFDEDPLVLVLRAYKDAWQQEVTIDPGIAVVLRQAPPIGETFKADREAPSISSKDNLMIIQMRSPGVASFRMDLSEPEK